MTYYWTVTMFFALLATIGFRFEMHRSKLGLGKIIGLFIICLIPVIGWVVTAVGLLAVVCLVFRLLDEIEI